MSAIVAAGPCANAENPVAALKPNLLFLNSRADQCAIALTSPPSFFPPKEIALIALSCLFDHKMKSSKITPNLHFPQCECSFYHMNSHELFFMFSRSNYQLHFFPYSVRSLK